MVPAARSFPRRRGKFDAWVAGTGGLSAASLKGNSLVKKDPKAAMELAEKSLENDPTNPQINHLLKEAAKAAGYPDIAAFALETHEGDG